MTQTMKALIYKEPNVIALEDVPVPKIEDPTDAIVRVTLSTICGSDIHIVGGHLGIPAPILMGHEFCGEVVEVGPAVSKFKVGDRVALSCIASCGVCVNCKNGQPVHCEGKDGGCFGVSPELAGCQTEFTRIPFADNTMYKIPATLKEEDVLFVGDILSTGYYGAERGNIKMGDTVLILGAGPVGMCAAISARLYSPSKIIIVDGVQSRLDTCLKNGVVDLIINFQNENLQDRVLELTEGRGVDVAIEAIGFESTLNDCIQAVRFGGNVSTVGVYAGPVTLPLHEVWNKNLNISTGFVTVDHMEELIKMIEAGKIDTRFLITHKKPLNDIIEGYDIFGNKKENCIKWLVTPYER